MTSSSRPGPARADRGKPEPFRRWLRDVAEAPGAIEDTALAYGELSYVERRQLLDVLARELGTRREVLHLFATMLALEDAPELQQALIGALESRRAEAIGYASGDERSGASVIARRVESAGVLRWEAFGVVWRNGIACDTAHWVAVGDSLAETLEAFAPGWAWEVCTARDATERLSAPLLRFVRAGGALGAHAETVADLIGLP